MPQLSAPEAFATPEALATGPQRCDPVVIEAPITPQIRIHGRCRALVAPPNLAAICRPPAAGVPGLTVRSTWQAMLRPLPFWTLCGGSR